MHTCPGCQRDFSNVRSLNSHKRFCKEWQESGLSVRNQVVPLGERKKEPADCPECGKTFKNIYAMSSHKAHCMSLNSTEHLAGSRGWSKGKILAPKEEIFCAHSRYDTGYAKKALIQWKLREEACETCGIDSWCDKPIVLELDHINGDNRDHRLENIRLLCPNCHSQTPTWRGRNKNAGKKKVTDKELLEALNRESSIRQALISVGLAAKGGNYSRCKKLLALHDKKCATSANFKV
jgi:hypothetical protein